MFGCIAAGVMGYRHSNPTVTVETLSRNSWFFDGMNVKVEAYVLLAPLDGVVWVVEDESAPTGSVTFLEFDKDFPIDQELKTQLRRIRGTDSYNRVRVRLQGRVTDNCKTIFSERAIAFGSCVGQPISIRVNEMTQLEPAKLFTNN
jgi:hypothetical protein